MDEPPAHRIEHCRGDAVAVVGYTDDPFAQYTALPPLAARLLDADTSGVLLVEQTTGDILARRALHPDGDLVAPPGPTSAPCPAADARGGPDRA